MTELELDPKYPDTKMHIVHYDAISASLEIWDTESKLQQEGFPQSQR